MSNSLKPCSTIVSPSNNADKRLHGIRSVFSAFVGSQQGVLAAMVAMTLSAGGVGLALTLDLFDANKQADRSGKLQNICNETGRSYLSNYFSGDGASHETAEKIARSQFDASIEELELSPSETASLDILLFSEAEWESTVRDLTLTVSDLAETNGLNDDNLTRNNFQRRGIHAGMSKADVVRGSRKGRGSSIMADVELVRIVITSKDEASSKEMDSSEPDEPTVVECHLLAYDLFKHYQSIDVPTNVLMLGEGNWDDIVGNYLETTSDDVSGLPISSGKPGAFCFMPGADQRYGTLLGGASLSNASANGAFQAYRYQRGAPTEIDWANSKFYWGTLSLMREGDNRTKKSLRETKTTTPTASPEGVHNIMQELGWSVTNRSVQFVGHLCSGLYDINAMGDRLWKSAIASEPNADLFYKPGNGIGLDNAEVWAPFYFYKGLYPATGAYSDWYGIGGGGTGSGVTTISNVDSFRAWNLAFEPRVPWVGVCHLSGGSVTLETKPWGEERVLEYMRENGYAGWRTSHRFMRALASGRYKDTWPKMTEFLKETSFDAGAGPVSRYSSGKVPSYIPFAFRSDESVKWDEIADTRELSDLFMSGRDLGGGYNFNEYDLPLPSYHFRGPPGSITSVGYDGDGAAGFDEYAEFHPVFFTEMMKSFGGFAQQPFHTPIDDILEKPLKNRRAAYTANMPGHINVSLKGAVGSSFRGWNPPLTAEANKWNLNTFNRQDIIKNEYGWRDRGNNGHDHVANYQQLFLCRTRSPLWPSGRNSCELHMTTNHIAPRPEFNSVVNVRQVSWLDDINTVKCSRDDEALPEASRLGIFGMQVVFIK